MKKRKQKRETTDLLKLRQRVSSSFARRNAYVGCCPSFDERRLSSQSGRFLIHPPKNENGGDDS